MELAYLAGVQIQDLQVVQVIGDRVVSLVQRDSLVQLALLVVRALLVQRDLLVHWALLVH